MVRFISLGCGLLQEGTRATEGNKLTIDVDASHCLYIIIVLLYRYAVYWLKCMMVLLLKHLLKPVKPGFYLLRLRLSTCADQQIIKPVSTITSTIGTCMFPRQFVIC